MQENGPQGMLPPRTGAPDKGGAPILGSRQTFLCGERWTQQVMQESGKLAERAGVSGPHPPPAPTPSTHPPSPASLPLQAPRNPAATAGTSP